MCAQVGNFDLVNARKKYDRTERERETASLYVIFGVQEAAIYLVHNIWKWPNLIKKKNKKKIEMAQTAGADLAASSNSGGYRKISSCFKFETFNIYI